MDDMEGMEDTDQPLDVSKNRHGQGQGHTRVH